MTVGKRPHTFSPSPPHAWITNSSLLRLHLPFDHSFRVRFYLFWLILDNF